MTTNNNVFPSISTTRNADLSLTNWSLGTGTSTNDMRNGNVLYSRPLDQTSKTSSNQLLAPPTTSFDRYLAEQRRLSDSISRSSTNLDVPLNMISSSNNRPTSLSGSNSEIPVEISRLYSYMSPVEDIPSPSRFSSTTTPWSTSTSDDSLSTYSMSSRLNGTNPFSSSSSVQMKNNIVASKRSSIYTEIESNITVSTDNTNNGQFNSIDAQSISKSKFLASFGDVSDVTSKSTSTTINGNIK